MIKRYSQCLFGAMSLLFALMVASGNLMAQEVPVSIDSRIRTVVYSPNEVFKMYTEYGYQSSIEFAEEEQITTISLGSPSAFKITPSTNRIFIKTLQKGRHTNMTVLTTHRSYYFELYSDVPRENDVIYVMRFYYPDKDIDDPAPEEAMDKVDITTQDLEKEAAEDEGEEEEEAKENYNYSLTGPEAISPLRVYDNGVATYFTFSEGQRPTIYGVNPDGTEYSLPVRAENGLIIVDNILPRYSLRLGSEVVCIFNEGLAARGSSVAVTPTEEK